MTAASAFPSFVDELPITRSALEFAAQQLRGQRREADHAPFILHPLEVAQLLRGRGYPDAVVAAGVLHDVIEDTAVSEPSVPGRSTPTSSSTTGLRSLEHRLGHHPLVRQLRFELEALELLPPT